MKKYEIMYILKSDLDETARKNEINKLHGLIEKNGGKITKVDEWGLRDLAYPIKKQKNGYYVVIKVECESVESLKEFDRLGKIDNNMLRFMITIDHIAETDQKK